MKLIIFLTLYLIFNCSYAHEGEHAAPAEVKSGTYNSYSEVLGREVSTKFVYDEPNFIRLGRSSRSFQCDDEGYICTDKRAYCDNDDVIIAFDGGFRLIPGCGESQKYFTIIPE